MHEPLLSAARSVALREILAHDVCALIAVLIVFCSSDEEFFNVLLECGTPVSVLLYVVRSHRHFYTNDLKSVAM